MDLSRHRAGEEITEGTVYRRIPNWNNYFDHKAGKPRRKTFEPRRPRDQGTLSMDIIRSEAERELRKRPGFGLCELDIGQMKLQTGGKVRVVLTATGKSHVDVWGCEGDVEVQEILASLARVLDRPK